MSRLLVLTSRAVVFAFLLAATSCTTLTKPQRLEVSYVVVGSRRLPERSTIEAGIERYEVTIETGKTFICSQPYRVGDTVRFIYLDYSPHK
jgi:hypothetical protein